MLNVKNTILFQMDDLNAGFPYNYHLFMNIRFCKLAILESIYILYRTTLRNTERNGIKA